MDFTVLNYRQSISVTTDLLKSEAINCVIWLGRPGSGKTEGTAYVQKALGFEHRFVWKPGHHEPYEVHGLPVPDHKDKRTYFYPAGDLLPPSDLTGGCLNVLDEGLDCNTIQQNLLCQMIYENGIHGYQFPENTKHIITGNRASDRSGAQRMAMKLGNRAAIITVEPQVREVFDHGMSKGWAPSVLSFLHQCGDDPINNNDRNKDNPYISTYFNSFDPTDPAQSLIPAFASSRSWEAVERLIRWMDVHNPRISDPDMLSRVAALVSSPVAAKFVPWRTEALTMPDPDAIAAGKKVPVPKKSSVLWTLTISLVTRATKDNFENIYNWLDGTNNREFAILFVKQCFDTKATKLISPAFNRVLQLPDVKQALGSM